MRTSINLTDLSHGTILSRLYRSDGKNNERNKRERVRVHYYFATTERLTMCTYTYVYALKE